eukprot:m51a1_g8114 hypothetical protein (447) ;mRNA; r:135388-136862
MAAPLPLLLPLLLSALAPCVLSLAPHAPVFHLRDFGAVPDGVTLNTHAFERAVDAISHAGTPRHRLTTASLATQPTAAPSTGGGRLVVDNGTWLTAPFNLTSRMTLYLTSGAVIKATDNFALWPVIPPCPSYGQGRDHPGPRRTSLVHGEHLEYVTITGEPGATIDGSGAQWWQAKRNGSETVTRGSLIEIMYSQHVEVSGLRLVDSPFWTVHPYDCAHVRLVNLDIHAPSDSPNTDGIDPDSCDDVLIENLAYDGGDDAIAVKSGWDCYGESYGRPCSNVVIRNVRARNSHSALTIGSEMSGGIRNVTATNLWIAAGTRGAFVKTHTTRGGYVSGVSVDGLVIGQVTRSDIEVTTNYGGPNPICANVPPKRLTTIDDISFRNVRQMAGTQAARNAVLLQGTQDIPVRSLRLEHVHLTAAQGFQCVFAHGTAVDVTPQPCKELTQA